MPWLASGRCMGNWAKRGWGKKGEQEEEKRGTETASLVQITTALLGKLGHFWVFAVLFLGILGCICGYLWTIFAAFLQLVRTRKLHTASFIWPSSTAVPLTHTIPLSSCLSLSFLPDALVHKMGMPNIIGQAGARFRGKSGPRGMAFLTKMTTHLWAHFE